MTEELTWMSDETIPIRYIKMKINNVLGQAERAFINVCISALSEICRSEKYPSVSKEGQQDTTDNKSHWPLMSAMKKFVPNVFLLLCS